MGINSKRVSRIFKREIYVGIDQKRQNTIQCKYLNFI